MKKKIGLIIALVIFVVPQLVSSLSTLLDAIPGYMDSFEKFLNQFISSKDIFFLSKDKIVLSSSEFTLTPEELLGIEADLKWEKKRKIFVRILDKCIKKISQRLILFLYLH